MSEEWGPWIEHDGNGCPLPVGTVVHRQFDTAPLWGDAIGQMEDISPVSSNEMGSWNWSCTAAHIIRYRVRQFRALSDLKAMIADPARKPAKEHAE